MTINVYSVANHLAEEGWKLISNTYKNLNTQTTAQAGDILNGKTAYDNNGNLITGTHSSGSCISSSFICDSGCDGNAGQNIIDFRPSYFVLSGTQSEYGYWWFSIYDATVSTTNTKYYDQFGNYSDDVASAGGLIISNNGVVIKNQEQLNKRMYYVACQ